MMDFPGLPPGTGTKERAGAIAATKKKPIAWIDPHGCSGEPCQVCITFCPVDCIRLVKSDPEGGVTGYCVVEEDKCIGCRLCAMYCPWEDILMVDPPPSTSLRVAPLTVPPIV